MQRNYRLTDKLPLVLFLIFISVLYLFILAELPICLNPVAGKDDGLYIGLGRAIAEGKWLGRYTSVTLVKGPGYPIFLALNHWTGLSLSVGHAIFQIVAALVFVYAIFRITGSVILVAITFCAIILNPVNYSADMARVARDIIYPYQTLLVIGLILLALYEKSQLSRVLFALLGGGALGWFWITREESVWILPGLVLLFFVVPDRWPGRVQTMLIVGIGAFIAYGSVGVINRVAYGSWTVTELNSGAFPLAMNALQRVDFGATVAQVPLTREARNQIYRVSPSFASLASYIERPEWSQISCGLLPHTCGEIAGGWFHWVVRDAAQGAGVFSTPSQSKAFFLAIANEVNSACDSGVLHCRSNTLLNLPRIELRELSQIPKIAAGAIRRAIFLDAPQMDASNSSGPESMILSALDFLNRPNIQPVTQDQVGFNNRASNRAHTYLQFRTVMSTGYALILKITVSLGVAALLLLTAMRWRNLPVLARIAWILVILAATRVVLLSFVEATSFPATSLFYLGPVSYLFAVAVVFSLYVFAETRKTMRFHSLIPFKKTRVEND